MDSKPYTKVNSKWIIDIHVKPKTTNTGESFWDLELAKDILEPKITNHKREFDKLDLIN